MTVETHRVVDTVIGPAVVLHQLALAVECLDAVARRHPATPVRIGRELDPRLLPGGHDPSWPCSDLQMRGPGWGFERFKLRTPSRVVVRIIDRSGQLAPRRFRLPLWTLLELDAAELAGHPVPGRSRLLRPWLLPGVAARVPGGSTVVRGRVTLGGVPVVRPRIEAIEHTQQVAVGWAHGDERGEFLLVVESIGTLAPPAPSDLDLDLRVHLPDPDDAAPTGPEADPGDAYADLVVEDVPRSPSPPGPQDVENDVLRGRAVPPGYVPSTSVPTVNVPVGVTHVLPADIEATR